MCTVTWSIEAAGYHLLFNRDELKSRQQAVTPSTHNWNKTKVIAPIDPDGGGTWVCTNAFGLSLCLLNNYCATDTVKPSGCISRGLLVRNLAYAKSIKAVAKQIQDTDLSKYMAFDLLCCEPASALLLISRDG